MINAEDLVDRRLLKVTTSWHHYRETVPFTYDFAAGIAVRFPRGST
ncbi:hypothetical protein ACFXB4_00600 [Streptomyces lavendulae]